MASPEPCFSMAWRPRDGAAAREAGRTDPWASLRYHLADAIAFRAVRKKLGGRLVGVLSGSATLNPEV